MVAEGLQGKTRDNRGRERIPIPAVECPVAKVAPVPISDANGRPACSPRWGLPDGEPLFYHLFSRVPEEGLEPTRPCGQRILSAADTASRVALVSRLCVFHGNGACRSAKESGSEAHAPNSSSNSCGTIRTAVMPPPAPAPDTPARPANTHTPKPRHDRPGRTQQGRPPATWPADRAKSSRPARAPIREADIQRPAARPSGH